MGSCALPEAGSPFYFYYLACSCRIPAWGRLRRRNNRRKVMNTEKEELFFYKKNVPYVVGIRMHIGDSTGKALSEGSPFVVVKEGQLRDFKRANKIAIMEGLIIATNEPDWDEETPNSLDDERASLIVKNVFALKEALKSFTGEPPVRKLLEHAEQQKRPAKTIQLIKDRLVEITGDEEDGEISPEDMQGIY